MPASRRELFALNIGKMTAAATATSAVTVIERTLPGGISETVVNLK